MKKLISLLLMLVLVFSICAPAFADEQQGTYNYVSFGASNTNGYGLHGYLRDPYYDFIGTSAQIADWNENTWNAAAWDPAHMMEISLCGYRRAPEGCYPDLIRDSLEAEGKNVQLDQFAMSSMRVEELRVLLDDSYEGDDYTKWRFYDPDNPTLAYDMEGGVEVMREYVQNSVKNADLITYDMGANNFAVYLSLRIMNGLFDNDFADIYGEEAAAEFYDMRSKVESAVVSMLGGLIDESSFVTIDDITDSLAYALLGYCYNFDKTMGIIRELNPDADIVVVSIQNTVFDMAISYNGIEIPFGELLSIIMDMANTYMMTVSEYKNEYCFANVSENGHVEFFLDEMKTYNGDPYTLSQSVLDCFNCLDNNLHVQTEVTQVLEQRGIYPGSDEYNAALYAAYDAIATMFYESAMIDAMPVDDILSGNIDIGDAEDYLMDAVREAYISSAISAVETPDTPYDIEANINELFENDVYRAVANYGVRAQLGNSFFAHPNYNGHIQLRDAILTALENKTSGNEALANALTTMKEHLIQLGITYGVSGAKTIAEKILSALGLDSLSTALNKCANAEEIANIIISAGGLDSTEKVELAEKYISMADSLLKVNRSMVDSLLKVNQSIVNNFIKNRTVTSGFTKLF